MNKSRGFTLVEMLVAATIAALLAAVGMVSYTTVNRNARNARRQSDLEQMRSALELYRTENGMYPAGGGGDNFAAFEALVATLKSSGFLTAPKMVDPRNNGVFGYSYNTTVGTYVDGDCNTSNKVYELCARLEPESPVESFCICTP